MLDSIYIPRLLDERERLFIFSVYEAVAILFAIIIGNGTQRWIFASIIGIILFMIVRKADQRGLFDTIAYYRYWYMPDSVLKLVQLNVFSKAPSYIRLMVG